MWRHRRFRTRAGLWPGITAGVLWGFGCCTGPALAACSDSPEATSLDWEITGFSERAKVRDSLLNPGNLLAELPRRSDLVEFRPDMKLGCDPFSFSLSPRWQVTRTETLDVLSPRPLDKPVDRDGFVNAASLTWNPSVHMSLELSRQALLWGPSLFFSPSNPFTSDNGRNSPYKELKGEDFVVVRGYWGDSSAITFYDNFAKGETDDQVQRFERTYAVTYEYTAFDWTATAVASHRDSEDLAGGFGQWTWNDYLLLFTDFSFSRNDRTALDNAAFPDMNRVLLLRDDDLWKARVTVGTAYTFIDGGNLSAEYFYNGHGLDGDDAGALFTVADEAVNVLETNPGAPLLVADLSTLGGVVVNHPLGLRRHYLALQYNKNDIADRFDAVARLTHSVSDGGNLLVLDFNTTVGDNLRLFLTLLKTTGGERDEFRQFYDNRFTLGMSLLF